MGWAGTGNHILDFIGNKLDEQVWFSSNALHKSVYDKISINMFPCWL